MAGGQQAYPLYVTVANTKKAVRRETSRNATALVAYLPVDDFDHAPSEGEKTRLKHTLTHRAMDKIMEPLHKASKEGVEMLCADGRFRRGYPIVAGVTEDWKEQCVNACVMESRCTRCKKREGRGDNTLAPPRSGRETLEALSKYFNGGTRIALKRLGLNPWWPWWANLPYVDFHACLMPDLLHQLYQGMIKTHLMSWVAFVLGKSLLDACFIAMPPAEGMRHFGGGISKLGGRWTGRESREVARQLLPIVAGQPTSLVEPNLVRVTRALLEFTYRAHASRMTEKDLERLQEALDEFHQYKHVLVGPSRVYADDSRFDLIAKLHQLFHFPECTREMGTPDGFSTEGPEHLHIGSAKEPWRASNKVQPTPQMVKFIQRHEALRIHRAYMQRFLGVNNAERRRRNGRVIYGEEVEGPRPEQEGPPEPVRVTSREGGGECGDGGEDTEDEEERLEGEDEAAEGEKASLEGGKAVSDANEHVVYPNPTLSIALRPTAHVRGLDLIANYGTSDLIHALHTFLKHETQGKYPTAFFPTTHHKFKVWHRLYLHHEPLPFDPENVKRDVIRARPQGRVVSRAFDVALLLHRKHEPGLHREYLHLA
ncbi:hypothetical protein FS749_013948 [Ceratobasidium sp. UAMH 11750]|nr:hypothetical protein FS749_013948 [Ceratobasidium sp. UAMH 11750]